jgi:hypothetical protein
MSRPTGPALLVVAGWLLVIVFGGLVLVGADEPGSAAIFAGIGLVMALWVGRAPGVAAFAVSLVLGLLQTAEQATYTAFDLADARPMTTVLADGVGLLGGLLVTVGAVMALLRRRRPAVMAEPVA